MADTRVTALAARLAVVRKEYAMRAFHAWRMSTKELGHAAAYVLAMQQNSESAGWERCSERMTELRVTKQTLAVALKEAECFESS